MFQIQFLFLLTCFAFKKLFRKLLVICSFIFLNKKILKKNPPKIQTMTEIKLQK